MLKIAIDGTAASGKGTLAKKLADKYGFAHLDTGLLYRKVADELIKKNIYVIGKVIHAEPLLATRKLCLWLCAGGSCT